MSTRNSAFSALAAAAAAVALAASLAGCGAGPAAPSSDSGASSSDSSGSGASGSGAAAEEKPATPGLNTPVAVGTFEYTALSAADIGTTIGTSPLTQTAQGTYFQVELAVANTGDKAETFLMNLVKLKDAEGRTYDADPTAGIYLGTDANIWVSAINPGNSLQGPIVFDLPSGVTPTELLVSDSLFSQGTAIALG